MNLNLKNALVLCLISTACGTDEVAVADLLLIGGQVIDGSGSEPVLADLAVTGEHISFLGDAASSGMQATDTVQVEDLVVVPGFIDMHSHAELDADHGRDARAFLHQGSTTVALGVDGGGWRL